MTKLTQQEAKDAIQSVRDTMISVQSAQRHITALHLTLDDPTPAYALEKIAGILSALAALELRLRGVAGSGELQAVRSPQDTPPETPNARFVPPKGRKGQP